MTQMMKWTIARKFHKCSNCIGDILAGKGYWVNPNLKLCENCYSEMLQ